jgi:hypothetical protein
MSARKDVHRIAISQAARTENKGLDGSYRRDASPLPHRAVGLWFRRRSEVTPAPAVAKKAAVKEGVTKKATVKKSEARKTAPAPAQGSLQTRVSKAHPSASY